MRLIPLLVDCCPIDCFMAWLEEGRDDVAGHFLVTVELSEAMFHDRFEIGVGLEKSAFWHFEPGPEGPRPSLAGVLQSEDAPGDARGPEVAQRGRQADH